MRICYLGAVWMEKLSESFSFDEPLPNLRRRYPFGGNLSVALAKRGHHVTIITLSMDVGKIEKRTSDACDVYVVPERRTRYQYLTLYRKEVLSLRTLLKEIKPDVVVANWTYQYARAAVTCGFPSLVIARDSPWRCAVYMKCFMMWYKAVYAQLFVFPRIKHLSTISPHMGDELRRFNHFRGRISIIPNGIDEAKVFINERGGRKIIQNAAKTIVCVSEWNKLKNVTMLIRALGILRTNHADWRLLLIGNGMDESGAGEWIRKHKLDSSGVELLGSKMQSEIQILLREEADVFCSPTLEESFGMVFLEAMAQGVPCIGGKDSGAVSWVMGDAGVTCDVSDQKTLAECIEQVMMDYELRRRLSENGVRRAKTEFSLNRVVDMYEEELRRIAKCG